MTRLQKLLFTAFLLGSIFLSGTVSALTFPGPIPGPLGIDFRDEAWAPAHDEHAYIVSDVEAIARPYSARLYQDEIDGLGILGGEPDEINYREKLKVNLGLGYGEGIYVSGVWITDLFDAPDGKDGEEGRVSLKLVGGGFISFDFFGNHAHQGNGELLVDFGMSYLVDKAFFYIIGERCNNEFSVAGFDSPVPEPATMLLLGSGLLGLAGAGRKKFFTKG